MQGETIVQVNDAEWHDALALSEELQMCLEEANEARQTHSESVISAVARRVKDA